AAGALAALGLQPEQRLLMFMADSPDFVTAYLGAMRIGAVPVPVSTMLHAAGLAELFRDSRARLLAAWPEVGAIADGATQGLDVAILGPEELVGAPASDVCPSVEDSPAFWLYASGTTGLPKGAMHRHGSIRVVCETYGTQVLGIRPDDR